MASLNTLRTRGGIIVSIVIGIALLAFLLTDLMTSGSTLMNANKAKVGEIDGESIGYITYSNQLDKLTQISQIMAGKDALSPEEQDQVNQLTWESLILENAYLPGFEILGTGVSEGEQIDMVSGVYISPVISGLFVNRETQRFDPTLLKAFIDNIEVDQTGQSAMLWNYMKEQMLSERAMSKYVALVSAGQYVADFEVEQALENSNNDYNARYVTLNYASIPDSTVEISASEIRNFYNAHPSMFRQSASRDIEYVMFELLPSDDDKAAAEKQVNELAEEFANAENPMQFATLNSQEKTDTRYYKESELPGDLAILAFGSGDTKMVGPTLNGNIYTISRVADMRDLPDSIGARHILLPITETQRADSIVAALKAGADFVALSDEFSQDPNARQRGGDLGMFTPDVMIPEFSAACIEANPGDIFSVKTSYGIHVVQLMRKTQPVRKAQIATITYRIEPSEATQQEVYGRASKFISEGAGSYENFVKAAADNAVIKRIARIRNTDRAVRGMENSRELVRWAFTGEKGDVSSIMDVDGSYVIAAITEAREDGIATEEQVAADIRNILILKKKAAMLGEKLQGNSLEEIAVANGVKVGTIDSLNFNTFYVPDLGAEQKLIGAVCGGAQPQTLSKPIDDITGVYKIEVSGVVPTENESEADAKVRLEAMSEVYLTERITHTLSMIADVKDYRVKFF